MNLITIDFETFYDVGFSLSNLTTEEYIRDPKFQVVGFAIKIDDGKTKWYSGSHEELKAELDKIDWDNALLCCHNMIFDGAILSFIYNITPKIYLDTLCMARAIHGTNAGGSLAYLSKHYNLGEKGTEVLDAKGKRLEDFQPHELHRYGQYCINDTELTYKLFQILSKDFPHDELKLIDITIRMFTEPLLQVNDGLLVTRLEELKIETQQLLQGLMSRLECEDEEAVRKKLASNKQFAELITELGAVVPMKISPTTEKETYALAKTDEGFINLQNHENSFIQELCAVRLGTKSTIEQSRIERFIGVGARNKGKLPIPLKYYGAHTGRWSGSDKVNFQNLPSRDAKKKTLKQAVVAPQGHKVINCDSSQIEARILVWLSGQEDVTQWYAEGRDVYCEFASKVYNRKITKADKVERAVGKTCISEGTPVLCESGWKPIEQVTLSDKLWDGEQFICHSGLVNNGLKETVNLCGVWLTPDHLVLSGQNWKQAQSLLNEPNFLYQALERGAENLPLQATSKLKKDEDSKHSLLNATAKHLNTQLTDITLKVSNLQDVISVQNLQPLKKDIGLTQKPCLMMNTALDFSIDYRQQYLDAITQTIESMKVMVEEAFTSIKNGEKIKVSFLHTFKRWMDGIFQAYKWIESITMTDTKKEISGSYLQKKTQIIKDKFGNFNKELKNLKKKSTVYDIANAGPNNRFTILTNEGPLIVHNCILGLGYGTGARKLQNVLKLGAGVEFDEAECKRLVSVYRDMNNKVTDFWRTCENALQDLVYWPEGKEPYYLDKHKSLLVDKEGIKFPNGLYIRYPKLRVDTSESNKRYLYKKRYNMEVTIWGGSVTENVVQALARIVIGEQMIDINEKYRPALTVHDAVVCVIPDEEVESGTKYIENIMSIAPEWANGLPIACESGVADNYGDC